MELHFLGTGAGMPSKLRNTSSLLVDLTAENNGYWLFDCGEATQHQLLHTSLKPRKIERIFITHLHGDHIFGLPGLISSRSFLSGEQPTPLHIYGPAGLKEWVQATMAVTKTSLNYDIIFHEIIDQEILFENRDFIVYVNTLEHVISSYGFRIEQKPLPGRLFIDQALALGVPKGPMLKLLKEGKNVTLPNGQTVCSKEVTGPPQQGFTLTILGDTKYCEQSIKLAHNTDILIHEATFNESFGALAYDYGHSTIQDAAKIAKQANAQSLIVNHISARFLPSDLRQFQMEGEEIFSPIFIANDFDQYIWQHHQLDKKDH